MSDETISIFILKAQPSSLTQAEAYLRNRKWVVGSGTNLREALAYLIQKHPKYIMITSDHPNRKVRVLPKMLVQAFPVRVIGFSEKNTGISSKTLTEMSLEYNLYAPVSGPAIERMVLKIRKDEELRTQAAEIAGKNLRADGSYGPSNETITFRGESASSSEATTSFEQARAALTQMLSSDGGNEDSGMIFQPGSATSSPGSVGTGSQNSDDSASGAFLKGSSSSGISGNVATTYDPKLSGNVASTNPAQMGGFTNNNYDPQRSARTTQGGSNSSHQGSRVAPDADPSNTKAAAKAAGSATQDSTSGNFSSASSTSPSSASSGFADGASDWSNPEKSASGSDGKPLSTPEDMSPSSTSSSTADSKESKDRRRSHQAPIMESDYVPKAAPKEYRITRTEERSGRQNDSIIVRGTEEALEKSVNLKNVEKAQAVEKSQNIACITVESPKFSGYLVCALGKNRKIDQEFFNLIQKRLFHFLRSNGEQIKESESMSLKIQEVDFTDWALEQAEFLRKSIHDGDEVAMAFFPSANLEISLADSASQKMLKMALSDLKEDVALEFDLYIFMPENNKYLLYTPKGMPFYGHQKGRLGEKGITHMHLRRESAHSVKKYKAQNFLNEKIKAYKAGLKSS